MNSDRRAHRRSGKSIMLQHEFELWSRGRLHVAGIDEAGRGPLAGPVVAAAVVFPGDTFIPGVTDSKQLTVDEREEFYTMIIREALAVGVGVVDNGVIDKINILNATFQAMHQAIDQLSVRPDHLLVDGNRFIDCGIPFSTIIEGDARSFSIASASIIAKVTRDRMMASYDVMFPGYGFAQHKGYATRLHREAILDLGYSALHRRSFALDTQVELVFED